jgi:hypothetical protein
LREVLDQANVKYVPRFPDLALNSVPPAMPPLRHMRAEEQKFCFPLSEPVRTALLEGGFHAGENIRRFNSDDIVSMHDYAPEALVAPLVLALSLAEQKMRGLFDLPSLQTAIVVLTSLEDSLLADHHRDLLWRAFGVPLFEQLRGWDGTIIARECEVHDGLHIDESAALIQLHEDELLATQFGALGTPIIRARTGLTGEIVVGTCECGAETPRLRALAPVLTRTAIALA